MSQDGLSLQEQKEIDNRMKLHIGGRVLVEGKGLGTLPTSATLGS